MKKPKKLTVEEQTAKIATLKREAERLRDEAEVRLNHAQKKEDEAAQLTYDLPIDDKTMVELLGLAINVDLKKINENFESMCAFVKPWTQPQRDKARKWVGACHMRASDNEGIRIPKKPKWVTAFEEKFKWKPWPKDKQEGTIWD